MSRKRSVGSPQPHEASLEPDEQLLCSVSEITEHLSRNITLVLESALSEIRKMVSVRVRVLRAELRQKSDEVELLKARLLEGQRSERRVKPAAAAAPVVKKENIDAICDFLMKDKNQRGEGEGEGSGDALSLWPDTSGPPDPETEAETDLFSSILPSASKRVYEYEWMTGVELTSDFKGEAEVKCDEAAEDEQMNHDSDADESTLRSVSEHFTEAPTSPAEEQRDNTHTSRADEPFSAHTFICPFCGTLCPTPSFLEEHVKLIHHEQATPSASSSSRGQGEAEEAGPRRAREKKVQGGYECGDCGRHFNYLGNLRQHQRIHTGEKPFACPECGERFRHAARLKSHRLSHSGAQSPFPCPQCGKGFPVLSGLKRHQRVHTGESPYACPQCGRRFKELGNLYTHMRIHSGATPYSCYQCGRSFRHLGTFKSHRCTAPPAWPQEDKVQTG